MGERSEPKPRAKRGASTGRALRGPIFKRQSRLELPSQRRLGGEWEGRNGSLAAEQGWIKPSLALPETISRLGLA